MLKKSSLWSATKVWVVIWRPRLEQHLDLPFNFTDWLYRKWSYQLELAWLSRRGIVRVAIPFSGGGGPPLLGLPSTTNQLAGRDLDYITGNVVMSLQAHTRVTSSWWCLSNGLVFWPFGQKMVKAIFTIEFLPKYQSVAWCHNVIISDTCQWYHLGFPPTPGKSIHLLLVAWRDLATPSATWWGLSSVLIVGDIFSLYVHNTGNDSAVLIMCFFPVKSQLI